MGGAVARAKATATWNSPGVGVLGAVLDTLPPGPSTPLLSAQEAKDRLREIVEGFFFRRFRSGDGKRIEQLVKSPLSKARRDWARRERPLNCLPGGAGRQGRDPLGGGRLQRGWRPGANLDLRPAPSARRGAEGGYRVRSPGAGRGDQGADPRFKQGRVDFFISAMLFCGVRARRDKRGDKRAKGRGEHDAADLAIGSGLGGANDTTTAGVRRLSTSSNSEAVDLGALFVGRATWSGYYHTATARRPEMAPTTITPRSPWHRDNGQGSSLAFSY